MLRKHKPPRSFKSLAKHVLGSTLGESAAIQNGLANERDRSMPSGQKSRRKRWMSSRLAGYVTPARVAEGNKVSGGEEELIRAQPNESIKATEDAGVG